MSYRSEIERLARAKQVEDSGYGGVRKISLDPVQLGRARRQGDSDRERRAIGRHWWEKVDVRALPPAPAGWPVDW